MPTNMSMQDLTGPALEAGNSVTNQALAVSKSVNDVAQTMTGIKESQQKQQNMAQQLSDMKFNSLTGRLQSQLGIQNPKIRKQVAEQNDKAGLAHPGFFSSLDDEDPESLQAIRDGVAKIKTSPNMDPQTKQDYLNAMADPTTAPHVIEALKQQRTAEAQQASARIAAGGRTESAEITGRYGLEKAKIMGGISLDAKEQAAVEKLTGDSEVKQDQGIIKQLKKDHDIIQEGLANGISPLKASELMQSYVTALKGMSARSGVGEREELASQAKDWEQRIATFKQKYGKQKGFIKFQDEPFLNDLGHDISGLHGTVKGTMQQRLNEKLRKSGLPSVNNAQQAAYNEVMTGAELGFKPRFKQVGTAPAEAAQVPAEAPPALSPAQQKAYDSANQDPAMKKFGPDQILDWVKRNVK